MFSARGWHWVLMGVVIGSGSARGQDPALTFTLVPIGGATVNPGEVVAIEVFVTGKQTIGIRGGQVSVPCSLAMNPGAEGDITILPSGAGATTDPEGDGTRGPSSGDLPFLFGPGGIGPYQPSTCTIATTPGVGQPPATLQKGETRYLGTYFYQVSASAAGSFTMHFKCEGGRCPIVPFATSSTRYRDDGPGQGELIPMRTEDLIISVLQGRCCRRSVCLGEFTEFDCLEHLGGTDWEESLDCDDPCPPCTQDADCDDNSVCTTDQCLDGVCQHESLPDKTPCEDNLFCTEFGQCKFGSCIGFGDPCAEGICSEVLRRCVECLTPDVCDDGDLCTTDICAADGSCQYSFNAQPCNDGMFCTTSDRCQAGVCTGSPRFCPNNLGCDEQNDRCVECTTDTDCEDSNECRVDTCVNGVCVRDPMPNGAPCDDEQFCTTVDTCQNGTCNGTASPCAAPGPPFCNETHDRCDFCTSAFHCGDQNVCTTDACNTTTGMCVYTNNTNSCNDSLFCTVDDRCADGICSGMPISCPGGLGCDETSDRCICKLDEHCADANPCTDDRCLGGVCTSQPTSAETPCDDGRFCTTLDLCQNGTCVGGGPSPCPDLFCNEAQDACLPADLLLSLVPVGGTDVEEGQIVAVEAFLTANRAFGIRGGQFDLPCMLPAFPGAAGNIRVLPGLGGGTTDPDGDALRGPSSGGIPYILGSAGLGPYAPATCIIANTPGLGSPPVSIPAGATRYLGTIFYQVETCSRGDFNVHFQCTSAQGGGCQGDPAATWTTRYRDNGPGMGNLLTLNVQSTALRVRTGQCCRGSECLGEFAEDCCFNVQGGQTWTEGLNCAKQCECASGEDCDDGNPCTADACVKSQCVSTAQSAECDDGLFCTVEDHCVKGVCVGGARTCPEGLKCNETQDECIRCAVDADCDDGNSCTQDSCEAAACVNTAVPDGLECDDADFCSATDVCSNGVCVGSGFPCSDPDFPFCSEALDTCVECLIDGNCSDLNLCTTDTCDTVTGTCRFEVNTEFCDDGFFCTIDDQCLDGACEGGGSPCPADQTCDEDVDACLPADATLLIEQIGGTIASGAERLSFEAFILSNRQLGIRGGQIDVSCSLQPLPGATGSVTILPGLAGATTDPDGDGLRGPSSQGIPYLFGSGALGPFAPASCIVANTPGIGSPPAQVPLQVRRYLATYFYEVSECASGQFEIGFECNSPGRFCAGSPSPTSGTRFREDSAGMGQLLKLGFQTAVVTIRTGQCCRGNSCLGDSREECCLGPMNGSYWRGGRSCEEACLCRFDAECDDENPCTIDSCDEAGACLYQPLDGPCDDGKFCTADDFCEEGACIGGASPCNEGFCNEELNACVECVVSQDCDDGNVCTTDRCENATGLCTHRFNRKPCSDGLYCTKPDICVMGQCVGTPRPCPPGLVCDEEADHCVPGE